MKSAILAAGALTLATAAQADTINVNGVERSFIFDQAGKGPRPLIIALHGGGGSASQFRTSTRLSTIANSAGVTVVYPESQSRHWNDGRQFSGAGSADDKGFIQALVADLAKRGIVDPSRVTLTGISNGGIMSFAMACTTSLQVYAIAPVSANAGSGVDCTKSNARILNIVGTADKVVPMQGGNVKFNRGSIQSSAQTFETFLSGHHCAGTQTQQLPDSTNDGMTSTLAQGKGCSPSPVVQIVVNGGGHNWPGSPAMLKAITGGSTTDFSASKMVVNLATGRDLLTGIVSTAAMPEKPKRGRLREWLRKRRGY